MATKIIGGRGAGAADTCRLTITIRGVDYRARPIAAAAFGAAGRAWRLRKVGAPADVCYDVAETLHGPTCDCADFEFRREGIDGRGCKHIRAMRALRLIG